MSLSVIVLGTVILLQETSHLRILLHKFGEIVEQTVLWSQEVKLIVSLKWQSRQGTQMVNYM